MWEVWLSEHKKNNMLWETVIPWLKINLTPEIGWLLCSFIMSMKKVSGCVWKLILPLLCNGFLNKDPFTKANNIALAMFFSPVS